MPLPILGPDACQFFRVLAANNDRTWFRAERAHYETAVLHPIQALALTLAPAMRAIDPAFDVEPAPGHAVSRIYRDMRFARPGTGPLREAAWLVFLNRSLRDTVPPAYFLEVTADGYRFGMGFYSLPAWRAAQVRAAIDREPARLRTAAQAALGIPGLSLQGPLYVRPKGARVPPDIRTWYERKCAHVEVGGTPAELGEPGLSARVIGVFHRLAPLYTFWRDSGSAGPDPAREARPPEG